MSSNIRSLSVGLLQTNCYIVKTSGFLGVIDPGDSLLRIDSALEGSVPTHVILTHSHFDHIGALKELLEKYPSAVFCIGEHEDLSYGSMAGVAQSILGRFFASRGYDKRIADLPSPLLLKDGDTLGPFTIIHTPGHTSGSICLYDEADKALFSGDTLFYHSYGRCDLGGNEAQMAESLKRILALPEDVTVYPGHGEVTSIGEERSFFGLSVL